MKTSWKTGTFVVRYTTWYIPLPSISVIIGFFSQSHGTVHKDITASISLSLHRYLVTSCFKVKLPLCFLSYQAVIPHRGDEVKVVYTFLTSLQTGDEWLASLPDSYTPRVRALGMHLNKALQIQRSRIRFPALPDFLRGSGSGTGSTQPR
jgi:hypothetical protein